MRLPLTCALGITILSAAAMPRASAAPADEARQIPRPRKSRAAWSSTWAAATVGSPRPLAARTSLSRASTPIRPALPSPDAVQPQGLTGPVSAAAWDGKHLPYVDNLVNLLVVGDAAAVPAEAEMLRVLAPRRRGLCAGQGRRSGQNTVNRGRRRSTSGRTTCTTRATTPWRTTRRSARRGTCNGPAARSWSRHHDHMASLAPWSRPAGGSSISWTKARAESILLPSQWSLIARDAFNGTVLWKRPIAEWNTQLWPLKSGPNQLPRRLVAVGDRVYVTLGIDAPLAALDAATGQTLRTYRGHRAHRRNARSPTARCSCWWPTAPNKWKAYRPNSTYRVGQHQAGQQGLGLGPQERSVMAVDGRAGACAGSTRRRVAPLTLAADRQRVYFYDGEKVVALDRRTGKPLWTSERGASASCVSHRLRPDAGGHRRRGAALGRAAVDDGLRRPADGKTLWTAPHHPGGHMSPDDMLVVGGLVWSADIANGNDSGW